MSNDVRLDVLAPKNSPAWLSLESFDVDKSLDLSPREFAQFISTTLYAQAPIELTGEQLQELIEKFLSDLGASYGCKNVESLVAEKSRKSSWFSSLKTLSEGSETGLISSDDFLDFITTECSLSDSDMVSLTRTFLTNVVYLGGVEVKALAAPGTSEWQFLQAADTDKRCGVTGQEFFAQIKRNTDILKPILSPQGVNAMTASFLNILSPGQIEFLPNDQLVLPEDFVVQEGDWTTHANGHSTGTYYLQDTKNKNLAIIQGEIALNETREPSLVDDVYFSLKQGKREIMAAYLKKAQALLQDENNPIGKSVAEKYGDAIVIVEKLPGDSGERLVGFLVKPSRQHAGESLAQTILNAQGEVIAEVENDRGFFHPFTDTHLWSLGLDGKRLNKWAYQTTPFIDLGKDTLKVHTNSGNQIDRRILAFVTVLKGLP